MLIVNASKSYPEEKKYIFSVILGDILGIKFQIFVDKQLSQKTILEINGIKITLPEVLFGVPKESWLKSNALPKMPLKRWDVPARHVRGVLEDKIPIIYGNVTNPEYTVPIDIFGSAFFMLTRYEEYVRKTKDNHLRFPAWDSLAYKEGFLNRPIINEYVEILWNLISNIDPTLKRKKRVSRIVPVTMLIWPISTPLTDFQGPWHEY